MLSKIDGTKQLRASHYVVSLVVTEPSTSMAVPGPGGHAVLIFETLTESRQASLWGCDFYALNGINSNFIQSTPGIVRTTAPISDNRGYHNKFCAWSREELPLKENDITGSNISYSLSWEVSAEQALEAIARIQQEEIYPPAYQLAGRYCYAFGALGDNCYTWAHKHLKALGINLKLSNLSSSLGSIPLEEIKWLLDDVRNHRDIVVPTPQYTPPNNIGDRSSELFYASSIGDYERVQQLIIAGVNIDYCYKNFFHKFFNYTPLLAAAEHGHSLIIKLLVENGADTSVKTGIFRSNRTAIAVAGDQGFTDIVEYLDYLRQKSAIRNSSSYLLQSQRNNKRPSPSSEEGRDVQRLCVRPT